MAHKAIGPGSVVASRFRLEDLLAEDAGARFWRATDLTLARNVALHVIDADDPRAPAVLTAARTSATVSDGHILRVLDALQEDHLVYVVHEWGSGMSLDKLLVEDTLDPRRAVWLVREAAEAITVAHRHGVAHGRLLPENVLVTDVGSVKLIGFVVGAVLHGRPRREGSTEEPPGEHESDVLNLGALLYACLTGKWPGFPASSLPDAPEDHDRICRPRQVRPGVPRRLDALCDQILNPDPRTGRRRYESAAEICAALGDYLGDSLSGATVALADPHLLLDSDTVAVAAPDQAAPDQAAPDQAAPDQAAPDPGPETGPLASTGSDPDATQPGMPAFATVAPRRADDTDSAALAVDTPVEPVHRSDLGSGRAASATGTGGLLPPAWGPDAGGSTGSTATRRSRRHGSPWLRIAAVVAALVLVLLAVAVAFSLGREQSADEPTPTEESPAATASPSPVTLASVADFDPEQDGGVPEENADLVPLATDGDPTTAWRTLRYDDGPVLAPYKNGVGLLLDLGEETSVREVALTLVGSPYDVEVLAAPEGAEAPTSVEGLTEVDSAQGVFDEVTLAGEEAVTTRYLVVWLTALPAVDGGFQGSVAEVAVRS